jgi:hypothetical protein
MLKYDPWATVARMEMEERVERAARARQRREARERMAGSLETAGRPSSLAVMRSSASDAWLWLPRRLVRRLDPSPWPKVSGSEHFWTRRRSLPPIVPEE